MQIKLTRKELYQLVWENSLTSLMSQYNISYLEIKDLLKKHNIPSPPNGYWSRLKAGYRPSRTPLPDDLKGKNMVVYDPKVINTRCQKKVKLTPMAPVKLESINNIEEEDSKAQKIFKEGAKGRPLNQLIPIGYESLMINVSPTLIDRSLSFMNGLIKEVKKNGWKVNVIPHSTLIQIDGEEFHIALREKQKRIENINAKYSFDRYEKVGSGILVFKIGEQWRAKEWSDTTYALLEDKIEDILQYLRSAAQIEKQERATREVRAIEQEKERQIKFDFDKRRAAELAQFIQLKQQSELWENAQRMRRYLSEIEKESNEKEENNETLKDYIKWAKDKIAWYDPLTSKQDELLNGVDKHTLVIPIKSYW